jgi:hypothetical protein
MSRTLNVTSLPWRPLIRRRRPGRSELASLRTGKRDGHDLETERQHVGEQPRLDDLVGIDVLFLAVGEALGEEAVDRAQGLQEAADAEITECDGMAFSPRSVGPSRRTKSV